jgi:hypothetical protein
MYNNSKKETMALISIPTSIGGITIPGLNTGPLRSLFGNPYSTSSYQYPSDLTAANKNHFVRFDIYEIQSAQLPSFSDPTGGKGLLSLEGLENLGNSFYNAGAATATSVADVYKSLTDSNIPISQTLGLNTTFSQNLSPNLSSSPVETIQLYTPDSIEFSSSISYDQESVLSAGLGLMGKTGKAIDAALKNSAVQLATRKLGYAINPQVQLIFQSIDFRDYSMSFVFTPNSREEAQNIQKIIKTFRAWAAPQIVPDTKGMFYKPPAIFDVSFYSNGFQNTKINKIQKSVILSVDVNYAPNGWSAHSDGAPVQTTMTLQLKETVLNDRDQIMKGGY